MTYIITFLCLLIALALFAGAFYLARHVVALQHRNGVLEDAYKEATDHIGKQDEAIITLQQEIDYMRRAEDSQSRTEPRRAWNPGNLMEMGDRR